MAITSPAMTRRRFLQGGAAAVVVFGLPSIVPSSVLGSNAPSNRIVIGCVGLGGMGMGNLRGFLNKKDVQIVAVCDVVTSGRTEYGPNANGYGNKGKDLGREPARQTVEQYYASKSSPGRFKGCSGYNDFRDLVARADIDAVVVTTPDHWHVPISLAAVKAGKDVYCEKPLAMRLDRLKDACNAVKKAKIVVQIGTQLRSLPTFTGCRELYKTGILGKVGRIEQCRNGERPYWYGYIKDVKEQDVDWKEFLLDKPMRPFDPVLYSGWYGYREFSDGPVPGLGSHFIDLVHYITGAKFPKSCVCLGGTFTWKDERNFTCPDHVHALWIYPEGFMVSYSTNFGNGSGNSFKIFGDAGVLDMVNWNAPILTAEGANSSKKGPIRGNNPVQEVERPDHFLDWLQCIRSRETPNASIDAGYQHAVACIMAMQSYDTGRRTIYDPEKREIHEG